MGIQMNYEMMVARAKAEAENFKALQYTPEEAQMYEGFLLGESPAAKKSIVAATAEEGHAPNMYFNAAGGGIHVTHREFNAILRQQVCDVLAEEGFGLTVGQLSERVHTTHPQQIKNTVAYLVRIGKINPVGPRMGSRGRPYILA